MMAKLKTLKDKGPGRTKKDKMGGRTKKDKGPGRTTKDLGKTPKKRMKSESDELIDKYM